MKSYLLVLLLAITPLVVSLLDRETVEPAAAKSEPAPVAAPAHPAATPANQSGSTKPETRNSK